MRICGIICEYNPFHDGHAYLLRKARTESGCDAIVCVMSGNFTQRGELAAMNKYVRARHALLAGADAVLELPAVFVLSSAELFAKGGVKLLASLPDFAVLAFGSESGGKEDFRAAALAAGQESGRFKEILQACLKAGKSFLSARQEALAAEGNEELAQQLSTPNNILGTEYTKALAAFGCGAEILPVLRQGAGYSDTALQAEYSSATAIRRALADGKQLRTVRKNIPSFVADDLSRYVSPAIYQKLAVYAALAADENKLKQAPDCTEGLENRIKALARTTPDYEELVAKVTTKRYTSSRVRRILAANTLGIEAGFAQKCLRSSLYLKPLAVRKERASELLSALARASSPLLVRAADYGKPDKTAKTALKIDDLADGIFALCEGKKAENRPLFL